MQGTAIPGERVIIVEVQSGRVRLKTGHIASTDSSHVQADNRHQTVVWGDEQFRPLTESPEEAHEQAFQVNDIHLLKEQEARSLQNPDTAQDWFGFIYQDQVVNRISRSLKRLQRVIGTPLPSEQGA